MTAICKINIDDIKEVNRKLKEGESLNSLDKNGTLKMSRKAFKNNAIKLGYFYNRELNLFICDKNVTPVTQIKSKEKTPNADEKDKAIEDILERLEILEEKVLHNNTSVTPNQFILDSRTLSTDIKVRSFKVSEKALNEFIELAESKLNMYSKQNLFTQALLEFVDKYK
ncbi:hypothetical protein [Clostridium perfringens]|jgi:hypothetical protein|nr:hypothetical protein [Clostridium perfringens]